jgi:hypothetical protein
VGPALFGDDGILGDDRQDESLAGELCAAYHVRSIARSVRPARNFVQSLRTTTPAASWVAVDDGTARM